MALDGFVHAFSGIGEMMTDTTKTNSYPSLKTALDKPTPPVLGLVKIGSKANLELLTAGKIRFRNLSFYKEIENAQKPFFDRHEGLDSILQAKEIYIELKSATLGSIRLDASNGLVGQVMVSINRNSPMLCMHALHLGDWAFRSIQEKDIEAVRKDSVVSAELKKFGDHVWVILNSKEFLKRLEIACQREKIGMRGELVRYVDPKSVDGDVPVALNGFVKTSEFSDEREFRFIVQTSRPLEDPFILDLGDLRDISAVMSFEEFSQSAMLSFK